MVHRDGKVFLLRRRYPPTQGKWALPGGLVELGESCEEAAARETLEETGIAVRLQGLLDVQTDLHRDIHSRIEYHYVLVDYVAEPGDGKVTLNPESSESGWFTRSQTKHLDLSDGTRRVIELFYKRQRR